VKSLSQTLERNDSAGTNIPHCIINWAKPKLRRKVDLPPSFAPVITSRGTLLSVPAVLWSQVYIERGASRCTKLDYTGFRTVRLPSGPIPNLRHRPKACMGRHETGEHDSRAAWWSGAAFGPALSLVLRLNRRLSSGFSARLDRAVSLRFALRVSHGLALPPNYRLLAQFMCELDRQTSRRPAVRFGSEVTERLTPQVIPGTTPGLTPGSVPKLCNLPFGNGLSSGGPRPA